MLGVPCYQVLSPTWYVSAMLIAMLFIYPFLLMKGQMFRTVASPIIAVISYGYLAVKVGILATIEPLEGEWVHTGLFRAFGGLSIGTIVFEIAENVLPNKRHSKVKLTAIELGCFICALLSMSSQTIFRPDFIVVLLLGIAVTLSFSGQTFTNKILPNPPRWLGKLRQHRTIAEASAVESPIRRETIGFPAHFFARAHNFKPPGRACQPEADSPMRT